MADPFLAEIRIFPFTFAPKGWASCNGQLMPISQNTALFSLLGTNYGGDGKSNFGLPNLQGRASMHPGQGAGLSPHDLGETGGSELVTLLASEIPAHSHTLRASEADANERTPAGQLPATGIGISMYQAAGPSVQLSQNVLSQTGGNQPHNNMMPYLSLNFCIAMQGVFPPRG